MDVTAEYRIEGIFYCFTEPVICGGMVRKVHAHTEQQSDFFGGKTCLEQIYDDYHGHGYAVVFFVYRRCNYLCFDIVVYHAFGQRLAAQAVKKIAKLRIDIGYDLIHIKINRWQKVPSGDKIFTSCFLFFNIGAVHSACNLPWSIVVKTHCSTALSQCKD